MSTEIINLKVREVIPQTSEAINIVFEHPESGKIDYKAGQFFTIILNLEGEEVRRAYSVCTSPVTDEYPAVTVKRVKDGKVSNYLNDNIKAGDTLDVLKPMGNFTTEISPKNKRHVILLGGGSGITPMMALMKSILHTEPKSVVSLIYANQNENTIIFKEEIQALQAKYGDSLNVLHVLEKDENNMAAATGYLNADILKDFFKKLPKFRFNPTEYYMCGPAGMMEAVESAFATLKISKDKLKKESFTADLSAGKAKIEASGEAQAYEVTVKYDGETHQFTVQPDKSILETALELDIDLPYSCQGGMCTACMGKCVSGKVELETEDALTPKELDQGYVLTCVGHPMSPDVVIEID